MTPTPSAIALWRLRCIGQGNPMASLEKRSPTCPGQRALCLTQPDGYQPRHGQPEAVQADRSIRYRPQWPRAVCSYCCNCNVQRPTLRCTVCWTSGTGAEGRGGISSMNKNSDWTSRAIEPDPPFAGKQFLHQPTFNRFNSASFSLKHLKFSVDAIKNLTNLLLLS